MEVFIPDFLGLPCPVYIGADFMAFAKIQLDFSTLSYKFAFDPTCRYNFERFGFCSHESLAYPCSEELTNLAAYSSPVSQSESLKLDGLVRSFPKLFLGRLGTVKEMVCELDLVDDQPVRSRPYQCTPPRLKALRDCEQFAQGRGRAQK
jgi:hypothetical protein